MTSSLIYPHKDICYNRLHRKQVFTMYCNHQQGSNPYVGPSALLYALFYVIVRRAEPDEAIWTVQQ